MEQRGEGQKVGRMMWARQGIEQVVVGGGITEGDGRCGSSTLNFAARASRRLAFTLVSEAGVAARVWPHPAGSAGGREQALCGREDSVKLYPPGLVVPSGWGRPGGVTRPVVLTSFQLTRPGTQTTAHQRWAPRSRRRSRARVYLHRRLRRVHPLHSCGAYTACGR
jgi:hypothetical protein